MSDSLVMKKVDKLLQTEVRTATNLEEEKTGFDAKYYSIEQTKEDISRIDQALQDLDIMTVENSDELEMSRQKREQLMGIKRRSQSHLLVNMGKRKDDSKEMSDVKINLLDLEKLLSEKADEPLTAELFNEIQMGYELTIAACRYYCDHKNPYFQSGKDRKAMVETVLSNLSYEADILTVFRNKFDQDLLVEKTIGEIFKLNKKERAAKEVSNSEKEENAAPIQSEPVKKEVNAAPLSKNGKRVENILSLKIWPSELIKKAGKSEKSRSEVIKTYMNLHETLRRFVPGKVRCVNVKIDGKEVRLLQKADNSLYIIENRKEYLMNLTAGLIADRIESDIIANGDIYGESTVRDVITGLTVKDDGESTGENLRVRELCLNMFLSRIDINKNDFNNVPTYLVRDLAEEFILGAMTKDEVISIIKSKDSRDLINGQENLEIVRVVKKQKDGELDSKVVLKKKEEEKDRKEKVEEGEQWSKEEEQVKNLIADLFYDNETWSHDELLKNPQMRVRGIIERNMDIIAKVFVDAYSKLNPEDAMIVKMLDKLPINIGGQGDYLKKLLVQKITDIKKDLDDALTQKVKDGLCAKFGRENVLDKEGNYLPDDKLSFMVKALRTTANIGEWVVVRNEHKMKEHLREALDDPDNFAYSLVKDLDADIERGTVEVSGKIQNVITEATGAIFGEKKTYKLDKISAEEYVRDLSEKYKGIHAEARRVLDRHQTLESLKEEEKIKPSKIKTYEDKDTVVFRKKPKTLDQIIEDSVKGKVGQGKFTKLVLQNYFNSVDILDKRAMIASAIRNAKPISAGDKDEETLMKEIAGNYLGGILKGAGPLMQKMMQGLPESGIPEEIAGAIKDMKSNLLPIPDELVKAQLLGMVERSKGKITKMEVTKALGAASVGQAFLCKMYGPTLPAEGKNVVVKLLRPDVRNHMEREKEFMLQCAGNTDDSKGMLATYQGRLEKIMEELDLTIEAKNCRMGYVYNDNKKFASVQSMKVNDIIEPTVNSLVLEQAEGTTVDKMFDETKTFLAELDDKYLEWEKDKQTKTKKRGTSYNIAPQQAIQYAKDRKKLLETLNSMEKRQHHLTDLAALWVQEGIFGAGFYHGDLHAGNIMINDDHATVIDYGNAVKLTAEQQKHIIRMMGAAASRSVDTYLESFHALLEHTKPEYYESKRKELEKIFTEVLNMGSEAEVGQRIMASLIRAQELGLELPSSVFNFSQGELLLQNTISDINKLIYNIRTTLSKMDEAGTMGRPKIDAAAIVQHTAYTSTEMTMEQRHSLYKSNKTSLGDVDKEELLSAVRKTRKIKANSKTGAPEIDDRAEFDQKYMTGLTGIKKDMYRVVNVLDENGKPTFDKQRPILKNVVFDPVEVRRQYDDLVKNYPMNKDYKTEEEREAARKKWGALSDNFVVDAMSSFKLDIFGGNTFLSRTIGRLSSGDKEAFEVLMDIYVDSVDATEELDKALKDLRKEQDSWFPDKEKLKQLEENFYQKYNRLNHIRGNRNSLLVGVENILDETTNSAIRDVNEEIQPLFEDEREGLGARLKEAFEAFRGAQSIVIQKQSAVQQYDRDVEYHKTAEANIRQSKINLEKFIKTEAEQRRAYETAQKELEVKLNDKNLSAEDKKKLKDDVERKLKAMNTSQGMIARYTKDIPNMEAEWERRKDEVLGERPPEVTEEERAALIEPKKRFMEVYRQLAVLRLGDMADNFNGEPGEENPLKEIGDIVGEVIISNAFDAIKMVGVANVGKFMNA